MTKKNTKFIAGTVALLAAIVFLGTAARALLFSPDTEVAAPKLDAQLAANMPEDQYPERLRIPSIGVDAAVQHVGVNAKGNMANPSNFIDVGWYKYGTPPGFIGSAVVAGHVDNGLKLAGVFKKLNTIKKGDDIYVRKENGQELHFRVVEIISYNYKEVPLEKLFRRADKPRLNLITCDGAWIANEKTYDQRLVVYTELVG